MANKNTDEQNEFLNELRESGETNMFGAVPYIIDEFCVEKNEALEILSEWMENFKK